MLKSIVRAFRYTPETLSLLKLDGIRPDGMWWLYQDCLDQVKEIKAASKTKPK